MPYSNEGVCRNLHYTIKLKKKKNETVNNDDIANIVNGEFDGRMAMEVVVSDVTYVKVAGKWNYVCVLLDLSNRQIIGSAVGKTKGANLVKAAFFTVKTDFRKVKLFHTDRGLEFKNYIIEEFIYFI